MFFIDYSLPWYSRYLLLLDAPFRFSWRHLVLYFHSKFILHHTSIQLLSRKESYAHLCIAFFEAIPIFGLLVALGDWFFFKRPLRVIALDPKDPSEAGKALVKECAAELHFRNEKIMPIYKAIVVFRGKKPYDEAKKLEKHIPERFIEEMKSIAKASGIAYEDILLANTIIDILEFSCSSLCAICKERETNQISKEFATNHFLSRGRGHSIIDVDRSFWRYDEMQACDPDFNIRSLKKMLMKVNYRNTIQTMIFDVNRREILLGVGGEFAANRPLVRFNLETAFGDNIPDDGPFEALLARNLDWPVPALATLTRVFVRRGYGNYLSTATVSWPGVIGAYSGMNEKGLSLASAIVPGFAQEGIPNQLLFRKILEESKSLQEALKIIDKSRPASAMNLMIAARDGIVLAELDPSRKAIGAVTLSFGK